MGMKDEYLERKYPPHGSFFFQHHLSLFISHDKERHRHGMMPTYGSMPMGLCIWLHAMCLHALWSLTGSGSGNGIFWSGLFVRDCGPRREVMLGSVYWDGGRWRQARCGKEKRGEHVT